MLTQADIDYMRRTADEYDALLKRWTAAPAYSQEIANLHATFKARAGDVGRMVENGLFRRVLATLDAGVLGTSAPIWLAEYEAKAGCYHLNVAPLEWKLPEGKYAIYAVPAGVLGTQGDKP